MRDTVTVDQLCEDPIEQVLCAVSYADKNKTSKRLTMFAEVRSGHIGFEILVMGKHYGSYNTIESAVEEYNLID